jgi:hypothetical protein
LRRVFAPALAAVLCVGCGGVRTVTVTRERAAPACTSISRGAASGRPAVELCVRRGRVLRTAFFVRDRRGTRRALAVSPPGRVGHWERGFLSPDGETLLAQWSAECEVPVTFFVPLESGRARPVAGTSLRDAPVSVAAGWLHDGRAVVEFPESACGAGIERPGVYAVAVDGAKTWLAPL